jgi:hypothetical protein
MHIAQFSLKMRHFTLFVALMGVGLVAQAQRGYFNQTELGLLVTNQSNSGHTSAASLHTTNGYRFLPGLAVGLGTGLDAYESRLLLPIMLAVTGDLGSLERHRVVPFYRMAVGHGFDLTKRADDEQLIWRGWQPQGAETGQSGGLVVQPTMGLKFRAGDGTAFTFQCGYRWQTVNSFTDFGNSRTEQKVVFRRLWLGIGFSF